MYLLSLYSIINCFLTFCIAQQAKVNTMIYQTLMNITVFVFGWVVAIWTDVVFTPWGILSGLLWNIFLTCMVLSVRMIGLSVAQSLWCGTTIAVSMIWGVSINTEGKQVKNVGLGMLGVAILILGIVGVGLANTPYPRRLCNPCLGKRKEIRSIPRGRISRREVLLGTFLALLGGVFNGSLLVPMIFAPENAQGIAFTPSFGIGTLIVSLTFFTLYYLVIKRTWPIPGHIKVATLPAIAGGIIWTMGNCSSFYALEYLGLTVGYPLTQCALFVAGLWGLLYYKEMISTFRVVQFFLSCIIMIGGAVIIALFARLVEIEEV